MNSNSLFNNISDRLQKAGFLKILLWSVLHLTVAICFLLFGDKPVEFNILKILPENIAKKEFAEAENLFSNASSKKMLVAIGSSDLKLSQSTADRFYDEIKSKFDSDSIVYKISDNSLQKIIHFFNEYKYQFLDDNEVDLIKENNFEKLQEFAYGELYSPLGLGSNESLGTDPFLFGSIHLKSFLLNSLSNASTIYLQDGYLTSSYDNKYWIIFTINTDSGFSLSEANEIPYNVVNILADLESKNDGISYFYSGVPFHTAESTVNSKNIIGFISTLSLILISLSFILVFRSLVSLIVVNLTLGVGVLSGLALSFVLFDSIHILTIVFGTSLIGISIDYSLHFFAERATNKIPLSSTEIIRRILPGISFGILTSIISYLAFIITNFAILEQVAIFSIFGLTSSYLTVILLYHYLPKTKRPVKMTRVIGVKLLSLFSKIIKLKRISKIIILALFVMLLVYGIINLRFNNNISSFYQVSENMKNQELTVGEITQLKSKGQYLIIQGDSQEQLLVNNKKVSNILDSLLSKKLLKYYVSLSQYLPSKLRQDEIRTSIERNLPGLLERQMKELGFDTIDTRLALNDFVANKNKYLHIADVMELPFSQNLKSLYLGNIGGKFYAAAIVFDPDQALNLKSEFENLHFVYVIDKINDAQTYLNSMSLTTILLLIISYLIIFIFFVFRYGIIMSLKVSAVPFLASLITVFIISALGIAINIFVVFALILIPGMGIDFALFFKESSNGKSSTMIAITISMVSTVMSFGLLFFAPFASSFGLSVAIGILISFLLTPIFVRKN